MYDVIFFSFPHEIVTFDECIKSSIAYIYICIYMCVYMLSLIHISTNDDRETRNFQTVEKINKNYMDNGERIVSNRDDLSRINTHLQKMSKIDDLQQDIESLLSESM